MTELGEPVGSDRAERLRKALAPPVALLASAMGLTCLLSMLAMVRSLAQLTVVDGQFVGWIGVGAAASVGVAAAGLRAGDRLGSGPPLALGAMAGVFGLTLGHAVNGSEQLAAAIVTCGVAAGGLLGGVAGMSADLPGGQARAVTLAWAVPLAAGWPVLVRGAITTGAGVIDVVVRVPIWGSGAAASVVVMWSVLAMLVEPVTERVQGWSSWEGSWAVVLLTCVVVLVAFTVLGFHTELSQVWLRPVIVAATAFAVAGWGLTLVVLPGSSAKLALTGVTAVMFVVPSTVTFAIADARANPHPLSWVVVGLISLAAVGGGVVVTVGKRDGSTLVPGSLALCCVAALGVGVIPGDSAAIGLAVAVLLLGTGAVLVAALGSVAADLEATRFVGLAAVCALVLGAVVAVPLSWALLGEIPVRNPQLWAAGRLYAGLTVAGTSMTAAYTWVLRGRIRSAGSAGSDARSRVGARPEPWYQHTPKRG